jgi:hypothetical protein
MEPYFEVHFPILRAENGPYPFDVVIAIRRNARDTGINATRQAVGIPRHVDVVPVGENGGVNRGLDDREAGVILRRSPRVEVNKAVGYSPCLGECLRPNDYGERDGNRLRAVVASR